jgi:uncharacterized membrane protein YgdD (TMEM256/DUF423 family)
MNKVFLRTGFLFAATAVILGAFGAHYLKPKLTPDSLAVFETGVKYQMYHAFAIIICGILWKEFISKNVRWAYNLFVAGIILFSISLYILTFFKANELSQFYWVGAITPLGGLCFVGGWLLLTKQTISK